jgi:hypothetical protein
MKTKLQLPSANKTVFILSICLALFLSFNAQAQTNLKGNFGFRVSNTISANRCGSIWASSLSYTVGRKTLYGGVMMQKNKLHLTGMQLGFEYTLLDPNLNQDCNLDWLELYAWINSGYHDNVYVNKYVCEEERRGNPELKLDIENHSFKTVETYGGFGVRINILKNLKWMNSIGIGGYRVLNPENELYYNHQGIGLMLRTGLTFQFVQATKASY